MSGDGVRNRLRALAEAAIFASPAPVPLGQLARALGESADAVRDLLAELAEEFEAPGHGLRLRSVAGGYQLVTKAEHHEGLKELLEDLPAPAPLSRPALETAAIIAYKQPITATEVQTIRGVRNSDPIRTLLKRKLIAPAGRAKTRGHPLRYKTTHRFLMEFGLQDLEELRTVEQLAQSPNRWIPGESA